MRRRTNKSSKVPNVKLRPAQEGAATRLRRQESSILAEDSQFGSDDTAVVDLCPRPFKSLVLCATGVVDKPTLFKQALELGATSVSAFTDRVTHLVAENHGGAKYNCAVERKIPILRPSWITESYQIWLRGDDVDLSDSVEKNRLPVFSGVALCLSGITDVARQTEITKLLVRNGGQYFQKLERPIRVTHLLCSGEEETDRMRYAEKFTSRGEANVHMVWEEWFWDSLEFGGRFNEQRYYVRHPRPERKLLPEVTTDTSLAPSSLPSSNAREAPDSSQQLETAPEEEGEEELASVKRLPAATLQLWGSLLGRRGYAVSGGQIVKSPSKTVSELAVPQPVPASPEGRNESLISRFRRSNSFAPARPDASSSTLPQPFRKSRAISLANNKGDAPSAMALASPLAENPAQGSNLAVATTSGIFSSLRFAALGEAKSPSVRAAIESNGGRLLPESSEENLDFVIVRLVSGSKLYQEEPDELRRAKYRTECWLERCVFEDRVCPADDHITFVPLDIQTPIPGAEKVSLSFSGLDQAEATWTTRLLRALGINLERYFSRKTTHLLCPSSTGPKFDKARQWGIPVITMEWLAAAVASGTIPLSTLLLTEGTRQDNQQPGSKNPSKAYIDVKGKGRAIETSDTRGLNNEPMVVENMEGGASHSLQLWNLTTNIPLEGIIEPHIPTSPRHPLEAIPLDQVDTLPTQLPTPTPLTPAKSRSEKFHFGRPTGALAGPSKIAVSTPPRTRSVPTIPVSRHSSRHSTHSVPTTPSSNRKLTQREIEIERKRARIPSSKSPSPLKVPQKQQDRFPTESPTRIPRDVAKALEDNITTLLGKRPSSEYLAPPGKRQRAQRPTRTRSNAQLPPAPLVIAEVVNDSINSFEPDDELNLLDSRVTDDSIRVTYEDPKQQEENQRLMNLLNVGSRTTSNNSLDSASAKGPLRTRKDNTRIAGF